MSQPDTIAYLTTKEVAALLRVKERKVYDLAAEGEIPHHRITGKLLFPAAEVTAWIEGSPLEETGPRPAIIAGSHDPLLDWALRESGSGLAALFNGSRGGIEQFKSQNAALCGMHIPEADGWNIQTVADSGLRDCVLISWAKRTQGLIVGDRMAGRVKGLETLDGASVMLRQPGAGARALFDKLGAEHDLSKAIILPKPAHTETDAASAVASGEADVAFGLLAAAAQFRLGFVPLAQEQFDLLIDRSAYFSPPVQRLIAFARTPAMNAKAQQLGGYDISGLGQVRWNAR
ncbi:MAG: putative molybdopterin biosynthesis protein [Paracoccaceae bacterium]